MNNENSIYYNLVNAENKLRNNMIPGRIIYNEKDYEMIVKQSTRIGLYTLDPTRTENINKCCHELGLLGGHVASHVKNKSLIDVESDLMGIRSNTKCPSNKFQTGSNPTMTHLKSCQFFGYEPVLLPDGMSLESCPTQSYNTDGSFSNNK